LQAATRNGERYFIFARLQPCRVEPQRPLLPQPIGGVVANGVGGDEPGGPPVFSCKKI
jgi:hypothetical protein